MAGRFYNPFPQFTDSTPDVYSGGKLYFYAAGTSTPLSTYTDRGLTSANTNPVILNPAGRPPFDIYLQDLLYKVVLKDASDNEIWTTDNYTARDSQVIAKTLTGSGSPAGVLAGTAGSASILPDFYWDYTNSVLYVCTTTGNAAGAIWTAVNASASVPAVPTPQGRLTLTSATPVLASGVSAGTAVYYTPYVGNLVPIYNGASMTPTEFSELSLTLAASHAASQIYDVFVFANAGVLTLVTGPAWSTPTAGSGSRGTGAGTTELTRVKGLYVNAAAMTGRNGATTYSVGANAATYLGSISMDGTNGQLSCLLAYGQSRKWGVWNAYNRVPVMMKAGDATASWTYGTATIRQSNAAAGNTLAAFCGLAEEVVSIDFIQKANQNNAGATNNQLAGIGVNSTTAFTGTNAEQSVAGTTAGTVNMTNTLVSKYTLAPALGINNFNALEKGGGSGTQTYYGTEASMLMTASYRA